MSDRSFVIKHFRIAFGNRIVAHMKKFVPIYVACGGEEVDGVDYFIARKILRKFEQLNISFIRDEIDGYVEFLDTTFGQDKMKECKNILNPIIQTNFNNWNELYKALDSNKKYWIIPYNLWSLICKPENKNDKGIKR